ncbi:hypothetical protein FLL76_15325, partial [Vibrio cholerae]
HDISELCEHISVHIQSNVIVHFFYLVHNARLRGWQRINTKLKYNNHNHCGSMGLETPRVDSPS